MAPSTTQKITFSRELKHDLVTDKYTEVSHKGTTTFNEVPVNAVITKNGVDYRLDYVDPGYAAGNKSVKAISPDLKFTNAKENNNSEEYDNLLEESADVEICLAQMKYLLAIREEDINKVIEQKLDRQLERIESE